MAINSVVQTESITVFGPPEVVEVALDIGPQGERGSLIYSGSGDPNINTSPFVNEPASVGDIYLRADSGSNYGLVYQYNVTPSGNQWQSILKLQPIVYNTIESLTFTSGIAQVSILVSDIYTDAPASLTASNFSIQLTPQHDEAVAFSVYDKGIISGASRSLVFYVKATEQTVGGGITNLSGTFDFNILINIVL